MCNQRDQCIAREMILLDSVQRCIIAQRIALSLAISAIAFAVESEPCNQDTVRLNSGAPAQLSIILPNFTLPLVFNQNQQNTLRFEILLFKSALSGAI